MITKWLLNGIFLVIQFLLSPLVNSADVALPTGLTGAMSAAWSLLMLTNMVVPIPDLIVCIGLLLAFEVAIFIAKGIIWGIKKIPFVG